MCGDGLRTDFDRERARSPSRARRISHHDLRDRETGIAQSQRQKSCEAPRPDNSDGWLPGWRLAAHRRSIPYYGCHGEISRSEIGT